MAYEIGDSLLRHRLQDKGMTQEELAYRLGITKQQINKYVCNQRKMSLQVAKNIASVLNCCIEDLYE